MINNNVIYRALFEVRKFKPVLAGSVVYQLLGKAIL